MNATHKCFRTEGWTVQFVPAANSPRDVPKQSEQETSIARFQDPIGESTHFTNHTGYMVLKLTVNKIMNAPSACPINHGHV